MTQIKLAHDRAVATTHARPAVEQDVSVIVEHVTQEFPATKDREPYRALEDISFSLRAGEFVSIVGPSGCGKSTVLSLIAGLLGATAGSIVVDGTVVDDVRTDVGFVFQSDVLLPWKTVIDNISLSLRFRGVDRREARERARAWISRVGLEGFEKYYPAQLSGGMRKRVQLASTLIYEPKILLMDEPFSALDAQMRNVMENDLLKLWAEHGATVVFVTHDIDEAIGLSDRILLMSKGPGQIKSEYAVPLPRPRDIAEIRAEPAFVALHQTIWDDLKAELPTSLMGDG